MKPPKVVRVGPLRYEIAFDQPALDRSAVTDGGDERDGEVDYDRGRIHVSPKLFPELQVETVFHEVLHTVTDQTGLRAELGEETDEKVVRRISPLLLDTLRRNPTLLRYLVGD